MLPSVSCLKHTGQARNLSRMLAPKKQERRLKTVVYEKFGWVHSKILGYAKGTSPFVARLWFIFLNSLCRFAFVDFTSIEDATAALINPKNHHLNGRTLVVEYAGADAVRRGAPRSARPIDGGFKGRGGRRPPRADNPRYKSDRLPRQAEEQPKTTETAETVEPRQRKSWDGKDSPAKVDTVHGVRHKGPKTRPKPGAALALAKRESVAIVPSQGKKITF